MSVREREDGMFSLAEVIALNLPPTQQQKGGENIKYKALEIMEKAYGGPFSFQFVFMRLKKACWYGGTSNI